LSQRSRYLELTVLTVPSQNRGLYRALSAIGDWNFDDFSFGIYLSHSLLDESCNFDGAVTSLERVG